MDYRVPTFLTALLLLAPSHAREKRGKSPYWTEPEKALKEDPDFSIQGEYYEKDAEVAAQVVALGGGKFDAYILEAGLPGLGWEPDKERTKLSGELKDGTVTFPTIKGTSAQLEKGKLKVTRDGKDAVALPRIDRKSPTLGAKAPEGAVILFDGSDASQWHRGKMSGKHLRATGIMSKPTFKNYKLHLEFRPPYRPYSRGQGRGNSGVYFGGKWETQILDSFGLTGEMNECGGIYGIAKPKLNMCLPPLKWQTYDVDFTAAKFDSKGMRIEWPSITVKLNGVLIHENQKLDQDFTKAAPIKGALKNEPRPIYLQNHGNPVVFRNIWVLPKE